MDEEQEEINQRESFTKQQMKKGKDKLKEEGKKQAKQKIVQFLAANPEVLAVLAIVIVVVILVVVLVCGALYVVDKWKEDNVNDSKQKSIQISYDGNTSTTETDDNGNIINKIVIKPNNKKDGYEISYNDDPENLENIKKRLEAETSRSASEFSEFELAVLGALMDNGANLDYYTAEQLHCFPAFIRAEACTQYLDLRPNSEKFKGGEYTPMQLSDFSDKNENQVPGVILVQRTNTEDNNPVTLEYKEKSEFDKLVNSNNKDAINYFTISDSGNLVIAKWDHVTVTVDDKNPDVALDEEIEEARDEDIITTDEIAYSQYITDYIMPFEFLVQLLVITEEPDFCKEVADCVLGSKIIIDIQEEKTVTDTTEIRNYTVHNKDEKRVDYEVNVAKETILTENGHFLEYDEDEADKDNKTACTNYATEKKEVIVHTIYTSNSYSLGMPEIDIWYAHKIETYDKQDAEVGPTETYNSEVLGEYKKADDKDIVDHNEINKDKDVKTFMSENKSNYDKKIPNPVNVTITSGTHENGDKFKQIHYINSGTVKNVYGLTNGATVYNEVKDENGNGTGEYNLPGSLAVEMGEVAATENTARIPPITYIYKLIGDKYVVQNSGNGNSEIEVTKLNIKDFQRVDVETNTSTTITKYPADSNPTTNIHKYATKSGTPGKGHGDENTEYEKFLVAYDNNANARGQINSIDYWLYEMMENNDSTNDSKTKMVSTVKYLLYMYDGKNRGVTELDLGELFENTNMSTFGGTIYGGSIEEKVWFSLIEQGYSEESVAAVMGNIYGESGFRADAVESNGEGYGLCQWSFGRKKQLINYAKSKGKDWTDEDTQIEFLIGEITKGGGANGYAKFQMSGTHYGYTYSSWKDATDVEEATKAFMAVFERPDMTVAHTDRRVQAAKDYLKQFHGKQRAGGEFSTVGKGDIIGTYTSGITGKTFTIFNQTMSGLGSSKGKAWTGYCNKCVAACIATGYNGGNTNDALNRTLSWGSILSNAANTNAYFKQYGLEAKVSGGGSYSVSNLRSSLTSGKYVAIWFNGEANGKSGQNYCHSIHWVGVIGYKNENGKEQIFISDSAHGGTGWKDLNEFESCKGKIQYFTVISER